MAPGTLHRVVECKTIDGTDISAWLYEAAGPAPAIIMSHGVCLLYPSMEILSSYHPLARRQISLRKDY